MNPNIDYIKKKLSDDDELMNTTFKQGDIVTTPTDTPYLVDIPLIV